MGGLVWILSNYFQNEPYLSDYSSLLLRVDFASAIFAIFFFYLFCENLFLEEVSFGIGVKMTSFFTLLLIILSFSDLIVKNIGLKDGIVVFEGGYLFWLYDFFIVALSIIGCYKLIVKYLNIKSREKKTQIVYIFSGIVLTLIIALPINLLLPQLGLVQIEINRIGTLSIFWIILFVSYAIFKHHLFDVKVIATEILSFSIIIILLLNIAVYDSLSELLFKITLFVGVTIFSIFLIRSTFGEIRSREKLAHMANNLRKANVELQKLDKAKSEFISIASHQLRTPLSIIKGYLSMVLEGDYGQFSERVGDKLKNTMQSNERLIRLVDDLLDLSHIEGGKMEYKFGDVAVVDLIKSIYEELKNQAAAKNLKFTFHAPKDKITINADEEKLRQVFVNLMDNAIKYTEKGKVDVFLEREDGRIIFSVKDTGIGVSSEEKKQFFEKFVRGKKVARIWTEGTGLGLYVARLVVEAHKGRIGLKSAGEGKGSEFWVRLPVKVMK